MQENNVIWVQTWMEKIAEDKKTRESLMLKDYGDCFELLFRETQQILSSTYLRDIEIDRLQEKVDSPYLIIRDGYFTFPYGLACAPELEKLPSMRKVAIHSKLNHFVDKGPWSKQELFFYSLQPVSYTPRKKLVLIVHQDFWDEGEKVIINVFQDFFERHAEILKNYKKIYLLDSFIDRDAQDKYLRICRQYGFPIEEVMKYKDLLYHEEMSQYAYHDLGDGHMSLDSYLVHSLLRNNIIPLIKEEYNFPRTAKYYPCSPRHGYYIWSRDASQDSLPDPTLYISKQVYVTDFLSKPFLNSCFEKEAAHPLVYKAQNLKGRKKLIETLRQLTDHASLSLFHGTIRSFEMNFIRIAFAFLAFPSFSFKNLEWRGSSVLNQQKNIFEADLDWNLVLKNGYSDWGLSYLVRLAQAFRFFFPNLDTPEFYTERELQVQRLLQKHEELGPFIKICRLLKKMSGQCKMIKSGTTVDQNKSISSLRRAMDEIGQKHEASDERFFPLVIDLDYYFSYFVAPQDYPVQSKFSCDIYSPYLDLWFNKESLIEFKFSLEQLQVFLATLPDATLSGRPDFVELRKKSQHVCLAYIGLLTDDWILGRSVQRLIHFKRSSEQYRILKKHLAYLQSEYNYWKKLLDPEFLKTDLAIKLDKIFDSGADQ